MKTKTGLLALGVFTIAGVLTVACGSSSSDGDDTPTAGTTGTSAGTSSGGKGSAGNSGLAGTTNSGAGTANSNGGTTSNGGRNNVGGFNPGAGGAGIDLPDCPATAMDGEPCTRMDGDNNVCQVNETTFCVCQGQNEAAWACPDLGDLGAGGDGGLGGAVTCPAAPKNGDTCTGLGLCPGSQMCGCAFGTVYCQM